jgi:hypothetical protein
MSGNVIKKAIPVGKIVMFGVEIACEVATETTEWTRPSDVAAAHGPALKEAVKKSAELAVVLIIYSYNLVLIKLQFNGSPITTWFRFAYIKLRCEHLKANRIAVCTELQFGLPHYRQCCSFATRRPP